MKTEFSEYVTICNPMNRFGKELRVICVPRRFIEDSDLHCGDGLEGKLIAKDLLYKIELWLADRDYLLISLYYFGGLTMKETGRILGVTEARVSQIHSGIIDYLRDRFN
jgi:DNA-directed RNA polymerase specialized sigma subunit